MTSPKLNGFSHNGVESAVSFSGKNKRLSQMALKRCDALKRLSKKTTSNGITIIQVRIKNIDEKRMLIDKLFKSTN